MADSKRIMEVEIKAKDSTATGTKSAEANMDKVSASAARLATAAAAATLALGTFVTVKSLELWAAQEQAIIQVENRLKSTGASAWTSSEQLQAMALSLQKLTTYGDESILQMQSLLLTFKEINSPEMLERATKATLDMASALAQSTGGEPDLRSAATMAGKALNDPIAGLTAMSRAGIQFTDDQKDLIKSLVETNKTAEAQVIILKELESQFGGAASARGLIGSTKQAKNAFFDLFEEFGKGITNSGSLESRLTSLTDYMGRSSVKKSIERYGELLGSVLMTPFNIQAAVGLMKDGVLSFTEFATMNSEELAKFLIDFRTQDPFVAAAKEGIKQLEKELDTLLTDRRAALFKTTKSELDIAIVAARADLAEAQQMLAELMAKGLSAPTADLTGGTEQAFTPPSAMGISLGGVSTAMLSSTGEGGEESETARLIREGTEQARQSLLDGIEDLQSAMMTEEQIIMESYQERHSLLLDAQEQDLISMAEMSDLERQIWQDKEDALTDITKAAQDERLDKFNQNLNFMGGIATDVFGAIADSAEDGSKAEFEANKKGSLSSAIVNIATGATTAYRQYGWPWGAVAAAAVIAAGATQINAIKNQEWGGSGSVSDVSSDTSLDFSSVDETATAEPAGTTAGATTYNITVSGNIVDQDAFARDLIPAIQKAQQDGV